MCLDYNQKMKFLKKHWPQFNHHHYKKSSIANKNEKAFTFGRREYLGKNAVAASNAKMGRPMQETAKLPLSSYG